MKISAIAAAAWRIPLSLVGGDETQHDGQDQGMVPTQSEAPLLYLSQLTLGVVLKAGLKWLAVGSRV